MKAQELTIESEVFDDFRQKLDAALALTIFNLKDKRLNEGAISCGIKIKIMEVKDGQGVISTMMSVDPDIKVKIGAKGKVECEKQSGLIIDLDEDRRPVVASNQIDIDELLREKEGA